MRRKHLVVIMLLMCGLGLSTTMKAQVTLKPGVGINVSTWSNLDGLDTKGKLGWQVGLSAVFGEKLYLEPGIFYQQRSSEISSGIDIGDAFDANDVSSIRIPVNVGVSLLGHEDSTFALRFFGGPTASIITSSPSGMDAKGVTWGVQAGAGVNFLMLYLDASYEWGMNKIFKDGDAKMKGFYLTAGIRL